MASQNTINYIQNNLKQIISPSPREKPFLFSIYIGETNPQTKEKGGESMEIICLYKEEDDKDKDDKDKDDKEKEQTEKES